MISLKWSDGFQKCSSHPTTLCYSLIPPTLRVQRLFAVSAEVVLDESGLFSVLGLVVLADVVAVTHLVRPVRLQLTADSGF